jgi:hypothetical protein
MEQDVCTTKMWNNSQQDLKLLVYITKNLNTFILNSEILGNILNKIATFVKWHITFHLSTCLWNVTYLSKIDFCNVHLYLNEVKAMDHCFWVSKIWFGDKHKYTY